MHCEVPLYSPVTPRIRGPFLEAPWFGGDEPGAVTGLLPKISPAFPKPTLVTRSSSPELEALRGDLTPLTSDAF